MPIRSTALLKDLGFHTGDLPAVPVIMAAATTPVGALSSEYLRAQPGTRKYTTMEENILSLLSDGHSNEVVASTLGITPSAISQYLSKEDFKLELAARKTIKLDRYKRLDEGYDRIEITLIEKLEASMMMLSRPLEIAAVLSKINAAKRRLDDGSKVQNTPVTNIINITLPTQLVHRFTKTSDGHVVGVDAKSLVTMPSHNLVQMAQDVLALPAPAPTAPTSLENNNA